MDCVKCHFLPDENRGISIPPFLSDTVLVIQSADRKISGGVQKLCFCPYELFSGRSAENFSIC